MDKYLEPHLVYIICLAYFMMYLTATAKIIIIAFIILNQVSIKMLKIHV